MPPKRDIDFCIGLILGEEPISSAPYCMTTQKLSELHLQLEDLSYNFFIRPKCFSMGSTYSLCEEEGWIVTLVHQLQIVEQGND